MHPDQIQLYRRLLFLSVIEASRNIACTAERPDGVSERAWNRWEAGTSAIPPPVADNLCKLIRQRQDALDEIAQRLQQGEVVVVDLPPRDKDNILAYRLQQSITAAALAIGAQYQDDRTDRLPENIKTYRHSNETRQ